LQGAGWGGCSAYGAGRLINFSAVVDAVNSVTPLLRTKRLILRPLTLADAPSLLEARSDPDVMRYWDWPPQKTSAEVAQVVADHRALGDEGRVLWWAVLQSPSGPIIGECDLSDIDRHHRRAELGFLFRRISWGKGYAREATEAIVNYAFGPLGMERLYARIHAGNERARRLLERLGFSYEGMLRSHVWREGARIDCQMFGQLRER
jgi:[ribosomal protein S5]-alanine N-acetyltransferase